MFLFSTHDLRVRFIMIICLWLDDPNDHNYLFSSQKYVIPPLFFLKPYHFPFLFSPTTRDSILLVFISSYQEFQPISEALYILYLITDSYYIVVTYKAIFTKGCLILYSRYDV